MDLLVIRHAIAEAREDFAKTGRPDDERPLTEQGRRKMERVVRGMQTRWTTLGLVATSPLARARQTAEILNAGYPGVRVEIWDELAPEAVASDISLRLRRAARSAEILAIVGHNPSLPQIVAWLVTGRTEPFTELKKGGLIELSVNEDFGKASATIVSAFPPSVLRALGD